MRAGHFWSFVLGALLSQLSSSALREEPLPEVPLPASAQVRSQALSAEEEADARVLSQLATGEDPRAAAAVTWVVLNRGGCRVAPLRCRRPVLEVVRQRRQFGTSKGGRWRPSWGPRRGYSPAVAAEVRAVLLGRVADPTGGATHFHRVGTWTPPWAPHPRLWTVLGSHAFYLEAGRKFFRKQKT